MDLLLQVAGWAGSALLVVSLLQSHMLALRILNLIAAVLLVGYNAALLVWPMVAMNAAVALIDIGHLVAIGLKHRTRNSPGATAPPEEPATATPWT